MNSSKVNYDALIRNALYWGDTFDDILNKYVKYLRQLNTVEDSIHANAIAAYHAACNNGVLLKDLRTHFKELNEIIGKNESVIITGRRKSFISYETKARQYISEGRSLNDIHDIFAFRIVLLENNSMLTIKHVYQMAEDVIRCFTAKGLTVEKLQTKEHGFDPNKHQIIVPRKPFSEEKYRAYIKDYIFKPKKNGYQSLHLVFKTLKGTYFEVQLRTLAMHVFNETENGSWEKYKKEKYKFVPQFNPQKILIPGYVTSSRGDIYDYTGLVLSKQILSRR